MRISTDNDTGKHKGLRAVRYGLVAALAFILVLAAIALAKDKTGSPFHAGSEDLSIPAWLA